MLLIIISGDDCNLFLKMRPLLMDSQKGFVPLLVVIVIAAVVLVAGAVLFKTLPFSKPATSTPLPSATIVRTTPTSSPTPTASPKGPTSTITPVSMVDCVGPDGKHFQASKTQCASFQKAWSTPTPVSTATATSYNTSSGSSADNSACSVGQVSVSIQPNNGSIVGDALIRITVLQDSGCNSGYTNQQVLSQGTASLNFSGLPPATYNLFVTYHGNQTVDSFVITPGSNVSKTVSVSN